MNVHKYLDKIFGRAEEINGAERCPTYMFRWVIAKAPWLKIYIHKFVGDDWSNDLHDHPKLFISIGLSGSYLERSRVSDRQFVAPWIRSFPAEYAHRITTPFGTCWTLVIVFKQTREWGFWHNGRFIPWRAYVGSAIADKMKSCA